MTRTHFAGILLAASTITLGTIAVVRAQDGAADAPAAAEKPHGHEHTPTTVHSGEKAFKLDDEKAYPDPDGFSSMDERISYAIGRTDGSRIPATIPDLDPKTYAAGLRKGLAEKNEDYVAGYGQGYELVRQFLSQQDEDFNVQAFLDGFVAAAKEKDESKSFGYLIGNGYRTSEVDLVADSYLDGIDEQVAANKAAAAAQGEAEPEKVALKLTQQAVQETLQAFGNYMQDKMKKKAIQEGVDYINGLKAEDGWKKTESGIAYKVVQAGKGTSPDKNDVATMHYEGKLLDGTVFDSSYQRGQTITFSAEQVISGWGEMLQLMKPGAIFQVVIPYNLAYGERGSPPSIPPFATLKFKMEMKSVEVVENKPPAPAPAPAQP